MSDYSDYYVVHHHGLSEEDWARGEYERDRLMDKELDRLEKLAEREVGDE